jgi:hypothetical protein
MIVTLQRACERGEVGSAHQLGDRRWCFTDTLPSSRDRWIHVSKHRPLDREKGWKPMKPAG